MRVLLVVAVLGCAAESEGPAKAASEPIPTLTKYERLHDRAGVVPGMPGFRVVHRVDPHHCGGLAVSVERTDAPLDASDLALENVLEIKFPTALDFSEPHKQAGLKKFTAWVDHMSALASAGRGFYSQQMMADGATIEERVIAAARIVQVQRHLASILVRAEIPLDVRGDREKTQAFCDRIAEVAEPIMLAGEGAAKVCANHAAGVVPGWWTQVCTFTTVTASVDPSTSR
jgi:hypothetical protein